MPISQPTEPYKVNFAHSDIVSTFLDEFTTDTTTKYIAIQLHETPASFSWSSTGGNPGGRMRLTTSGATYGIGVFTKIVREPLSRPSLGNKNMFINRFSSSCNFEFRADLAIITEFAAGLILHTTDFSISGNYIESSLSFWGDIYMGDDICIFENGVLILSEATIIKRVYNTYSIKRLNGIYYFYFNGILKYTYKPSDNIRYSNNYAGVFSASTSPASCSVDIDNLYFKIYRV